MLEVKVTIEAPALTEALHHLAIVLEGNGKSGRSSAAPVAESQEAPPTHTPPAAEPAPMATNMGYATLFEIPAERYGALAATLRGLGAQI